MEHAPIRPVSPVPPVPEIDPYAAPQSDATARVATSDLAALGMPPAAIWRSDRLVVMRRNATLPDRCIRCNATADRRVRRNLRWGNPWLIVLVGPIVYLVIALVVRESIELDVPLCGAHARRRHRNIWLAWSVVLAGVAAAFVAVRWAIELGLPALLLVIAGSMAVAFAARLLVARRIDAEWLWLRHASPAFLDSLAQGPARL